MVFPSPTKTIKKKKRIHLKSPIPIVPKIKKSWKGHIKGINYLLSMGFTESQIEAALEEGSEVLTNTPESLRYYINILESYQT